jgi:formyl-CoA transferase
MSDADLLFEGLKVLDVGSWIAGPVAATILADYGAEVIKIELPGAGDGYRQFAHTPGIPDAGEVNYTWLMDARNKRSLTLNLKNPRGKAILEKLVENCDVYVTNHPQSLRRSLGLTYEELAELNPRLIYASLTAYGENGPERDREGFDLVAYWARSGLMDLVRQPGTTPNQSLPGMGDHPTAVALYASIVTALLRREQTGKGSKVHTSLIGNGLWAASCLAQAQLAGADFSLWYKGRGPTRALYQAADGRWLQFTMVRTRSEFSGMLQVLGLADLVDDERFATPAARIENGAIMVERMTESIAERPSTEWLSAFEAADVPAARVATLADLDSDPQLLANGILMQPEDEAIPLSWMIDHPVNVDALPRTTIRPGPELGEHTDQILTELGYDDAARMALRTDGVI